MIDPQVLNIVYLWIMYLMVHMVMTEDTYFEYCLRLGRV